jgi:hypothetical protein
MRLAPTAADVPLMASTGIERAVEARVQEPTSDEKQPRKPPVWIENRVREELGRFLRNESEWPSYREFQRAGRKVLRDNVTRYGGARWWAQQMGVRYVERRPGYPPVWTEQRIRRDLSDYLSGRGQWPSRGQFERDGRTALRNAINRTGGPDRWAAEFGVARTDRLSGVRRGWTQEAIEAELRKLIGRDTVWPSRREFEQAGLYSMLISIYRHEGPGFWAERMGVERRPSVAKGRAKSWTEDRIRSELEPFCAERQVWPTEREFIDSGKHALYAAASRNGGVARWAAELGLPRRHIR